MIHFTAQQGVRPKINTRVRLAGLVSLVLPLLVIQGCTHILVNPSVLAVYLALLVLRPILLRVHSARPIPIKIKVANRRAKTVPLVLSRLFKVVPLVVCLVAQLVSSVRTRLSSLARPVPLAPISMILSHAKTALKVNIAIKMPLSSVALALLAPPIMQLA